MKRLSDEMYRALASVPGLDANEVRKAARTRQVRQMWEKLVEDSILAHTNGVYVFTKDGKRQMHVYMDESIYAAELNNRRELLKLRCMEEFNEPIDEFCIHISKGKYKGIHPFARTGAARAEKRTVPLTEEERRSVDDVADGIPDARLKEHFKEAMARDLEWKKGASSENRQII